MIHLDEMREAVSVPWYCHELPAGQLPMPVVGYVCSYMPEEIVVAARGRPVRLFGVEREAHAAQRHLQTYVCSLVRGILEEGLSGEARNLTAMVFPDACDAIRRLSDIWRLNVPGPIHLDLVLPVKLDTESARIYMRDILERFRSEISVALGVTIDEDKLGEAVIVMNEIRNVLAELNVRRSSHRIFPSAADFYTLVRAAMIMERRHYLSLLREVLTQVRTTDHPSRQGKRVFLIGGLCKIPEIYTAIENAGGDIVGDDLCSGARYFLIPCRTDLSPMDAIAERLLTRPPCPAKHQGQWSRGNHILKQIESASADAVIMVMYKFCDPHAFDYPYLKRLCDDRGLPVLLLEVEDPLASEGQIQTRCEALLEMI